jgi:DNA uptake protein ComE-like DNA-binding protein
MSKPTDATQFTLESAERIARVVRAAELGSPQARALTFDRVEIQRKQKPFRVCTFTGAWSIDSAKTVTFRNVTSTPNTVSAVNLFAALTASGSARACAIAKDGTAWYLIAARC